MQKRAVRCRVVLVSILLSCLTGCSELALKDAVLYEIETPVGVTKTISMGETLLTKYACPCYEYYLAGSDIRINNYRKSVLMNSEWVVRYTNPFSNEKYLVNESFHPALALVLVPSATPTLSVDHAVIQVQGNKQGRTWSLSDPGQASAIRLAGYEFSREAWRLQYIGPDKEQPQVLRFTIDDLRDNRERVGQIEYAHDLRKGKEFVVRGVRFRIVDISSDGLVSYLVVSDGEWQGS
jgi:hypothetical protein